MRGNSQSHCNEWIFKDLFKLSGICIERRFSQDFLKWLKQELHPKLATVTLYSAFLPIHFFQNFSKKKYLKRFLQKLLSLGIFLGSSWEVYLETCPQVPSEARLEIPPYLGYTWKDYYRSSCMYSKICFFTLLCGNFTNNITIRKLLEIVMQFQKKWQRFGDYFRDSFKNSSRGFLQIFFPDALSGIIVGMSPELQVLFPQAFI